MTNEIHVPTKFGIVTVKPTNRDHIYVGISVITVRGIIYHGGVHLYLHSDTKWRVGREQGGWSRVRDAIYLSRDDRREVSMAAQSAIVAEMEYVINIWVATGVGQQMITAATEEQKTLAITKQEELVAELEGKLKDAKAELERLRNEA